MKNENRQNYLWLLLPLLILLIWWVWYKYFKKKVAVTPVLTASVPISVSYSSSSSPPLPIVEPSSAFDEGFDSQGFA